MGQNGDKCQMCTGIGMEITSVHLLQLSISHIIHYNYCTLDQQESVSVVLGKQRNKGMIICQYMKTTQHGY